MSRRSAERLGLVALVVLLAAVLASATLVDRVPPSVQSVSLTRTAGTDDVGLTHTAVAVEFSEPVDQPDAQTRFRIEPAVAGAFTWDGDRTMIFTPADKLPTGTSFTVSELAGYADENGNAARSAATKFTFATVVPPRVKATAPAAGAQGVDLDGPLTITF
ncbi:MAG TPA: Ig-like domain-containing protein, partial [Candidatus Limnocylindrales bacterium]|nr:Ig-like domain-containing protein [Candidatus Limnocylindrales bacterium]